MSKMRYEQRVVYAATLILLTSPIVAARAEYGQAVPRASTTNTAADTRAAAPAPGVAPAAAKLPVSSAAETLGLRLEATGLSLPRSYERGKIPVVLIHGLWSGPWSWARLIQTLDADPAIRDRYQLWTFGYSTGDPIPYSAYLLRHALAEARARFDPDHTDPALDRMTLVGHSMGGILARMMVQDSKTQLWELIGTRPIDTLNGPPDDVAMLRQAIIYQRVAGVRRVVFIATPHRGSRLDAGPLHSIGSRLVRLPDPLKQMHASLLNANGPDAFTPRFRAGLPTSVDQLAWDHPLLIAIGNLGVHPEVRFHSIIADRRDPPKIGGTDGVVPYESAHLDGAASEHLVSSSHLCQDHPNVARELRRILIEQEPL